MVKLTQSLDYWLYENHRDIYSLVLLGHVELITDEMAKNYLEWCKTEEGRQYLRGGSKYKEGTSDAAKEYLSQYCTLDAEISCKLEQAEQLRAIATKVSPSTGFGAVGGISDRVGATVAKIIDLENEINDDVDRLVELKADILKRINSIRNSLYRTVLIEHYLNRRSFDYIGEATNFSRMQICRIHGMALTYITPPGK